MLNNWKFPKASRAAQNALMGHMRPVGRVFESLDLQRIDQDVAM